MRYTPSYVICIWSYVNSIVEQLVMASKRLLIENTGSNGVPNNDRRYKLYFQEKYAWFGMQTVSCTDLFGTKFKKLITLLQKDSYDLQ